MQGGMSPAQMQQQHQHQQLMYHQMQLQQQQQMMQQQMMHGLQGPQSPHPYALQGVPLPQARPPPAGPPVRAFRPPHAIQTQAPGSPYPPQVHSPGGPMTPGGPVRQNSIPGAGGPIRNNARVNSVGAGAPGPGGKAARGVNRASSLAQVTYADSTSSPGSPAAPVTPTLLGPLKMEPGSEAPSPLSRLHAFLSALAPPQPSPSKAHWADVVAAHMAPSSTFTYTVRPADSSAPRTFSVPAPAVPRLLQATFGSVFAIEVALSTVRETPVTVTADASVTHVVDGGVVRARGAVSASFETAPSGRIELFELVTGPHAAFGRGADFKDPFAQFGVTLEMQRCLDIIEIMVHMRGVMDLTIKDSSLGPKQALGVYAASAQGRGMPPTPPEPENRPAPPAAAPPPEKEKPKKAPAKKRNRVASAK